MVFNEADDDLTGDGGDETSYRDRAAAVLDEIAQQVKQALKEQSSNLDIFFVIPRSGDAILVFGTLADPNDEEWERVAAIVSAVVCRTINLDQSGCRNLACAYAACAI